MIEEAQRESSSSSEGSEDSGLGSPEDLQKVRDSQSAKDARQAHDSTGKSDGVKPDGWYPGKYLGRKKRTDKKNTVVVSGSATPAEPTEPTAQDIEESSWTTRASMSSWFGSKKDESLQTAESSSLEDQIKGEEGVKSGGAAEEVKKESMICATVRNIRAKYLKRQLIGRIYIYRLSGVISTAVTSDITAEDVARYLIDSSESQDALENDPITQAEITGQYKRALSTTDAILNSLERRSLAWEKCDFAHNTLLTRGTTLGVSDPIVGIIGFSFTLELSASVGTLLASRRRFEAARELVMDSVERASLMASDVPRRSSFTFSMPSMSMFSSSSTSANAAATAAGVGVGAGADDDDAAGAKADAAAAVKASTAGACVGDVCPLPPTGTGTAGAAISGGSTDSATATATATAPAPSSASPEGEVTSRDSTSSASNVEIQAEVSEDGWRQIKS
jgi:hypothetical protein